MVLLETIVAGVGGEPTCVLVTDDSITRNGHSACRGCLHLGPYAYCKRYGVALQKTIYYEDNGHAIRYAYNLRRVPWCTHFDLFVKPVEVE